MSGLRSARLADRLATWLGVVLFVVGTNTIIYIKTLLGLLSYPFIIKYSRTFKPYFSCVLVSFTLLKVVFTYSYGAMNLCTRYAIYLLYF